MDRRDLLRSGAAALVGGAVTAPGAAAATAPAQQGGGGAIPGRRSDAWIGVDFANLTSNFNLVKSRAGDRPVMAVVKADGYGHGVVPVAEALAQAGADAFMVSNTQEAMALRLAGITQPILHFGPLFSGVELLVENDIQQMVDSREALSGLVAAAAQNQAEVTVQVHVDTGLGRMGVPWQEAAEFLDYVSRRSRVKLAGVSTTFTEDPEFDREQLRRFLEVCDTATAAGVDVGMRHAASSAAVRSATRRSRAALAPSSSWCASPSRSTSASLTKLRR